ncbi:four helix bundle protein [Winogradskyella pacifica]|uniref:Four helix bundle protein n=1 Tax=Winogradskyella pacifica TaxID=664642 RepID=A0A3D9MAS7_9FLAO|nr:four helix bundle protein [Winogradskyella pacifica]REE16931.1 four helix bundle protein [Winogradskyella pacifica]
MNYTELDVWKSSRELVKNVYLLSDLFPKEELYALTNQLKRCSISIPSNIAEGLGRQSNKETIHFLYISRGSLFELETQLYLAFDLNDISKAQLETILIQVTSCKKLLNGFINYFKSKE